MNSLSDEIAFSHHFPIIFPSFADFPTILQDDCIFFDPVAVGVEHRPEALGATFDPGGAWHIWHSDLQRIMGEFHGEIGEFPK